jgi:hypothetical protein
MTQQKRRLNLTVPLVLHKLLKEKTKYHGKTINALCLEIFWDYFEKKEPTKNKPA